MYDSLGAMIFWLISWPVFIYIGYLFAKWTAKKVDILVDGKETEE